LLAQPEAPASSPFATKASSALVLVLTFFLEARPFLFDLYLYLSFFAQVLSR